MGWELEQLEGLPAFLHGGEMKKIPRNLVSENIEKEFWEMFTRPSTHRGGTAVWAEFDNGDRHTIDASSAYHNETHHSRSYTHSAPRPWHERMAGRGQPFVPNYRPHEAGAYGFRIARTGE
jgi:hypothetical protein